MRTILFTIALSVIPMMGIAQTTDDDFMPVEETSQAVSQLQFGYLSYFAVMQQSSAYAAAQEKIKELRQNYQKEMDRSRDEFNIKYESFLDEQASLDPPIRRKRQVELEDVLEANKSFRKEAQRLLQQAEDEALRPVKSNLNAVIASVARELNLAFVINTDGDNCPYINPNMGVDITTAVLNQLK